MAVDEKVMEQKIASGQDLTPEEEEHLMAGGSELGPPAEEEEGDEKLFAEIDGAPKEEPAKPEAATPAAQPTSKATAAPPETPAAEPAKETPAAAGTETPTGQEGEPDKGKVEAALDAATPPDMKGWTDREVGLYYAMRRERRGRQTAEKERNTLQFRQLREEIMAREPAKPKEGEEAEPGADDLVPRKFVETKVSEAVRASAQENWGLRLRLDEMEARQDRTDFVEVMLAGKSIIAETPDYQDDIREAFERGENLAITTYNLIKSDQRFTSRLQEHRTLKGTTPAQPTKQPAQAPQSPTKEIVSPHVQAAEKVKQNAGKPITSGAAAAGGGGEPQTGKTIRDYLKMTPQEFGALPMAEQDRILLELGS